MELYPEGKKNDSMRAHGSCKKCLGFPNTAGLILSQDTPQRRFGSDLAVLEEEAPLVEQNDAAAVVVHLLENLLKSLVIELVALAELLVNVLHSLEALSVVELAIAVGIASGEDVVDDSVEFSEGVGHFRVLLL